MSINQEFSRGSEQIDEEDAVQSMVVVLEKTQETPDNPFRRRARVGRTPPSIGRAHSWPDTVDATVTPGEREESALDNGGKEKRKRQEGDTPPKQMKRRVAGEATSSNVGGSRKLIGEEDWHGLRNKMNEVSKIMKEVAKQVKMNINTKVEIKKTSATLKQTVNVLEKMFEEVEAAMEDEEQPIPTKKSTRSIGTQVDSSNIKEDQKRVQDENMKLITEVLGTGSGFGDLAPILDIAWPAEAYKLTTTDTRDLVNMQDRDLVMFAQGRKSDSITNRVAERYPEFMELMINHDEQLPVDFMKFTTKIIGRNGVSVEKDRFLFAVRVKNNDEGFYDMAEIYEVIKELKDLVSSMDRKHLAIIPPDGLSAEHLRRMLEYVYHNSGVDIMLPTSKGRKPDLDPTTKKTKKKKIEEALVIRSGGQTFANLVRGIKDSVNVDEIGVKIKALKRTGNDDLLIKVDGDRAKAEVLKEKIQMHLDGSLVSIRETKKDIFISDIDAGMTAADIENELKGTMMTEEVIVKTVRPARDGNQVAIVEVRPEVANEWTRRGQIKLGWVFCRIRGKTIVPRCFKCLQFGHRRMECTGEDRSDMCLRCGNKGHRAKDCSQEPYCMSCDKAGHRSDSRACPHFRSLLDRKEKSALRRKKDNYN